MLLVRIPNWLGDVVMATPVLRSLTEKEDIALLGLPAFKPLLEGFPGIKAYYPVRKGLLGIWFTARFLHSESFSQGLLLMLFFLLH